MLYIDVAAFMGYKIKRTLQHFSGKYVQTHGITNISKQKDFHTLKEGFYFTWLMREVF